MLDIPEKLYKALQSEHPKDQRNSMKMYPSSASMKLPNGTIVGACARAQYYRWFECIRDGEPDPEGALIFATGDALHDMVVRMIRSTAMASNLEVLTVEQAVYEHDLLLSGRSDFVVMDRNDGSIHGCEVKTVGEGAIYIMSNGGRVPLPKIEHLMQATIYLDKYRKNAIETGTRVMKGFILLYVARSESWKLKSYPHGSHFKHIWQYYMTMDDTGKVTVTDQRGDKVDVGDLNINYINDRYTFILDKIKKKELPDREFAYQYSEDVLKAMSDAGKLNKAQTALVDKWVDNGAKAGSLTVEKGDFQCIYCNNKNTCYSATPDVFETESHALLPYETVEEVKEEKTGKGMSDVINNMI